MAATPFALAAAELAAPSLAHAVEPYGLVISNSPTWVPSGPYTSGIQALRAEGLPRVGVDDVLADLNHDAVRVRTVPGLPSGRLGYGFRWRRTDFRTPRWRPQGITTNFDGWGRDATGPDSGTGKKVVLVSWYATDDADSGLGARVTFVDITNRSRPRYRHVLLIQPYNIRGGDYTFGTARIHAGGIAWYGNRLYIADTNNGLRVYNLDDMFKVPRGSGIGRQEDGSFHAYGYEYVLPQSRDYLFTDPNHRLSRYSQVAVDRTTSPHTLLVSEFHERDEPADTVMRAVRWNLHPTSGALVPVDSESRVYSTGVAEIRNARQTQGAVSAGGRYYLSISNGTGGRGYLRTWQEGSTSPAARGWRLPIGPEDLSHHGGTGRLWGLNEYERNRYVFAMEP
ncbi:hypothetical protein J7F01_23080 [Streptomyces sp. ISL-22]|uniref:hypothetical protein n=1 Tax=unclassified Streptomyces TaxID=2593676 RepID=UPI001BE8F009|nr:MULTISPECIES: hypothetical protein [unclassified Streptomyces]MBT2420443.1 hypothetical protein [Streptomyces sp. ISL-24]MBT2435001.1 hypothetical protein [Streptomyces sp. ISL-22]